MAKGSEKIEKTKLQELVERLDGLNSGVSRLLDEESRLTDIVRRMSDTVAQLREVSEKRLADLAAHQNQLAGETNKTLADMLAQFRGVKDELESLAGQIVLLQTRMESLDFQVTRAQPRRQPSVKEP